ncbi:hypothetical protein LINPERPRIM_LOCUS5186, partial [Linum perenne]
LNPSTLHLTSHLPPSYRHNRSKLRNHHQQPPTSISSSILPQIQNHNRLNQALQRQSIHPPRLLQHWNLRHRHNPQHRCPLPRKTPHRRSLDCRQRLPFPPFHKDPVHTSGKRGPFLEGHKCNCVHPPYPTA